MSISSSYPTQRPKLNLVFNGGSDQLDSRISYSRSSSGTAFSAERHLSSENLITQSQFSGWSELVSPTVTAAYTNGPDGSSNTATRLQSASGADRYFYSTSTSWASGQQYTVSCWVKSNTGVAQTFAFFLPLTAYASADLTTHASDWTRITATFTAATSSIYCGFKLLSANTTDLSIWGFQVNSGANALDYQATSGQIHRSFAPTLKSYSSDQPRFEYSAADGQSDAKGLLIEAQATNLARYSSDISSWNSTSTVTLTSNAGIAPNGQLEADLIVFPSSASQHYVYDNTISLTSGTTYTTSVYVKSAGQRYFQLCGNSAGFGYTGANFDLQAVSSVNINSTTSTITAIGSGWYRLTVTMAAAATTTGGVILIGVGSSTAAHFAATAGDDYSGVLCWGFQTEVGSSASSIISTSGAAATKSADSCSVALSDVGIANGQDLTLVVEGDYGDPSVGANDRIAATLGKDSSNWVYIANRSGKAGGYIAREGGTNQADNTGTATAGKFKSAVRVSPNNYGQSVNGGAAVTDTSGSVPLYDTLSLGKYWNQAYELNGTLSRVSIYSEPLSDTNLTALSSS